MKNQNDYTLDTPLYPVWQFALVEIVLFAMLYLGALLESNFDGETLLAGAVVLAIILGATCLAGWFTRKCRFRVDAEGIRINRLRGKVDQMRWQDVRTAAIVHMDEDKWIVLSTLEPGEVLVRQRLQARQDSGSTVLHLNAGIRNRTLVEHHLRTTLPDIHLDKKRKEK